MKLFEELKQHIEKHGLNNHPIMVQSVGDSTNDHDQTLILIDERLPNIPVYVTMGETKITCVSTLFSVEDISADKKPELDNLLLTLNPTLNLSNYGLFNGSYSIFGELSSTSTFDNLVLELETLFENTEESLQLFVDFLKD